MAVLTDQQRKFYETTLQVTKQEIGDLKDQIEEELAKVKDRIAELQNAINASKQTSLGFRFANFFHRSTIWSIANAIASPTSAARELKWL